MDTTKPKPWWTSRAMLGGLLALAVGVLQTLGVIVAAEDQASILDTLVSTADSIAVAAAGILALWGRYKATQRIAPGVSGVSGAATPLLLLGLLLALGGCVTAEQVERLQASIDQTRTEIREQPQTPQTQKAVAVLDQAEAVVANIQPAPTGDGVAAVGSAIQAAAPLAGSNAPWLMLAGGLLVGLGGGVAVKRAADNAFYERVQRGAAGEVKPAEP